MNKLEDLEKKLDRVKDLMDATGMSMEDLIADSAMVYVDCNRCPIKTSCDQYNGDSNISCTAVWSMYLRGEINKNA